MSDTKPPLPLRDELNSLIDKRVDKNYHVEMLSSVRKIHTCEAN